MTASAWFPGKPKSRFPQHFADVAVSGASAPRETRRDAAPDSAGEVKRGILFISLGFSPGAI